MTAGSSERPAVYFFAGSGVITVVVKRLDSSLKIGLSLLFSGNHQECNIVEIERPVRLYFL